MFKIRKKIVEKSENYLKNELNARIIFQHFFGIF